MRSACANQCRDKGQCQDRGGSHHIRYVVLVAMLGGLPLGGCTEKPDNRIWKQNITFAKPDKSRRLTEKTPRPIQASARPVDSKLATRTVPEISEANMTSLDPGALVGLAPPAVDRILGKPRDMRTEAMAVQWTYSGSGNRAACSLEIFFYPDIVTGDLRVLKYNVTNKKGEAGGDGDCANFLMMARSDGSD